MSETVEHNEGLSRFELYVDGAPAGFTHYHLIDGVARFDHTEVSPALSGRGLATTLVRGALDQVRAAGLWRVQPVCPFVALFIERHPDYADLLAD